MVPSLEGNGLFDTLFNAHQLFNVFQKQSSGICHSAVRGYYTVNFNPGCIFRPVRGLRFQPGFRNKSSRNEIADCVEKVSVQAEIPAGFEKSDWNFSARSNRLKTRAHIFGMEFQPGLKFAM